MYNSLVRQFKLRKNWIIFSLAAFEGIALLVQLLFAFALQGNHERILCGSTEIILIFYTMFRIIIGFSLVAYQKNLAVGFGETRKRFIVAYSIITYVQYLLVELSVALIMLLGKEIWSIRFGTWPEVVMEFNMVFYIVIFTLAPMLEIFMGLCYDTFGPAAYWIIFVLFIGLGGFAGKISTILENYNIIYNNVLIGFIIMAYIITIVGNILLNRKSSVK